MPMRRQFHPSPGLPGTLSQRFGLMEILCTDDLKTRSLRPMPEASRSPALPCAKFRAKARRLTDKRDGVVAIDRWML
jgi:hypothetical protein